MSAVKILEKAADHLKDRAATYDKPEGERSIGATVEAFNVITGDGEMNSEERGWLFMAILEMVSSQQGNYQLDNYENGAAYFALMGEAACNERNGGWSDEEIKAAAFRQSFISYDSEAWPDETRIDVIGPNGNDASVYLESIISDVELNDWAKWVAIDADGGVWVYSHEPRLSGNGLWQPASNQDVRLKKIKTIALPTNHINCLWNCLWEIKR